MIDAKELRIGNWVDYDFVTTNLNGHTKLDEDLLIGLLEMQRDFEQPPSIIKPIPLSPDILERCGFKYDINLSEYKHSRLHFVYLRAADDYNSVWITSPDSESTLCSLQHLHQLQNLYYFLVGEELVIESPVSKI